MAKIGKRNVRRKRQQKGKKRGQRGAGLDIQKLIEKTGKEFHWPKMNYLGPGTRLNERLRRRKVKIIYNFSLNLHVKGILRE